MNTPNNCIYKGGIEPLSVKLWTFSQFDVTKHLQNTILGLNVMTEFVRWFGTNGNSYVRMRVVIPGKDIIAPAGVIGGGIIQDMLMADGAPYLFREDVINTLKPFMLPSTLKNVRSMPDMVERLARQGIAGANLEDLIKHVDPLPSRDSNGNDWCCLYLRAEAIIEDMVKVATTDKTEGLMQINRVNGGVPNAEGVTEPITWDVFVNGRKDPSAQSIYNVTVESLFRNTV